MTMQYLRQQRTTFSGRLSAMRRSIRLPLLLAAVLATVGWAVSGPVAWAQRDAAIKPDDDLLNDPEIEALDDLKYLEPFDADELFQNRDYGTWTDVAPYSEEDRIPPWELEEEDDLDRNDPRFYAREYSDDYFSRRYFQSGEYLRSAYPPPDIGDDGLEFNYGDHNLDYDELMEKTEGQLEDEEYLEWWWQEEEVGDESEQEFWWAEEDDDVEVEEEFWWED